MKPFRQETGEQLAFRLLSQQRPSLEFLDDLIFFNKGPFPTNMIEITGESNVGKSLFLMEIIAKTILPSDFGGRDAKVIFLDTDNDFDMIRFLQIIDRHLDEYKSVSSDMSHIERISKVKEESLKNLIFQKCFSAEDLDFSLRSLNELCTANPKLILLIVESISAFYFSECTEVRLIRMETYHKKLYDKFLTICQNHKLVCIYVRPSYFASKKNLKIHFKIELIKREDNQNYNIFIANLTDDNTQTVTKYYTINNLGLKWLD